MLTAHPAPPIKKIPHEDDTPIAAAVEEQSATTADIARTIAGTTQRSQRVSREVQEMIQHHEQVHVLAYRIAQLYHDRHQQEAAAVLETFKKTSQDLFAALDKLYSS